MFNNIEINAIEKNALEEGYFEKYLPAYPALFKLLHNKHDEAMQSGDEKKIAYWNALHHFMYMVFENLRFLCLQLKDNSGTGHNVYLHLPTFMSTFMMGFPIADYLKIMICIISVENSSLDKCLFKKIIKRRKCGKEFSEELEKFLDADSKYPNCTNIKKEWKDFTKANEIRNKYTHAFRLPWWHRNGTQIYGFPKAIFSDPQKIKEKINDEMWEFVTDAQSWEKKVSSLPDTDFISGADLIRKMHDDGTKIANTLFQSFVERINLKTTKT